jgi:hypothetical protein
MISKWKSDYIQLVIREPKSKCYDDSMVLTFEYNDIPHNIDFPAIIGYEGLEFKHVDRIVYQINGGIYRPLEDGPCRVDYYYEKCGNKHNRKKEGISSEYFSIYINDCSYHRVINYRPSSKWKKGEIKSVIYTLNFMLSHRSTNEGPAETIYYRGSNKFKTEKYYVKGMLHRPIEEGPAIINYSLNLINGKQYVTSVQYYVNNQLKELGEDKYVGLKYDCYGNVIAKLYRRGCNIISKKVTQTSQ